MPFELSEWNFPGLDELPRELSWDVTQWHYDGKIVDSSEPIMVAVSQLLGYEWPAGMTEGHVPSRDDDGIVALPALAGERAAADRIRDVLAAAYGTQWSTSVLDGLLSDAGGKTW